uniref:Uncharacterized protein n=1 Tax=Rhizophora mucronata TaxID=61149 RepID=A0A2P2QKK0_RHIMU
MKERKFGSTGVCLNLMN